MYVECEISEGLRPSEATVEVIDIDGVRECLRVERHFIRDLQGKSYLPVGIVQREVNEALIELPHEADSGHNRLWVATATLIALPRQEPVHDPV